MHSFECFQLNTILFMISLSVSYLRLFLSLSIFYLRLFSSYFAHSHLVISPPPLSTANCPTHPGIMPNLACQVGKGVCGISRNLPSEETLDACIKDFLGRIFSCHFLPEHQLDQLTALSGSGIAFVSYSVFNGFFFNFIFYSLFSLANEKCFCENKLRKQAHKVAARERER